MSNWKFLNDHRCRVAAPGVSLRYVSTDADGWDGMFRFTLPLVNNGTIRCISSNGMGWQHVSVSIEGERRVPPWPVMCAVKDLFWEPEDWVAQFHPAQSEYVNFHPGVLHLWRPTEATLPTPISIMVGPKLK